MLYFLLNSLLLLFNNLSRRKRDTAPPFSTCGIIFMAGRCSQTESQSAHADGARGRADWRHYCRSILLYLRDSAARPQVFITISILTAHDGTGCAAARARVDPN